LLAVFSLAACSSTADGTSSDGQGRNGAHSSVVQWEKIRGNCHTVSNGRIPTSAGQEGMPLSQTSTRNTALWVDQRKIYSPEKVPSESPPISNQPKEGADVGKLAMCTIRHCRCVTTVSTCTVTGMFSQLCTDSCISVTYGHIESTRGKGSQTSRYVKLTRPQQNAFRGTHKRRLLSCSTLQQTIRMGGPTQNMAASNVCPQQRDHHRLHREHEPKFGRSQGRDGSLVRVPHTQIKKFAERIRGT